MIRCIETYKITADFKKSDPPNILPLQNLFVSQMSKRLRMIRKIIKQSVYDNDCFGLKPRTNIYQLQSTYFKEFEHLPDSEKIDKFIQWLDRQFDEGLINEQTYDITKGYFREAWYNPYIRDAYKRATIMTRNELISAGYNVPAFESDESVDSWLNTPEHRKKIGLMTLSFIMSLKGLKDGLTLQISRVLNQSMLIKDSPWMIFRKINAIIEGTNLSELGITDTLGRFIPGERRAEMIVRTEMMKAYSEATLQELRNWEVKKVKVLAEFRSMRDDKVCSKCESLDGEIFTLDGASGIIPVHPSCRCIFLPVLGEE